VENSCKSITSKKPIWVYRFLVKEDHILFDFIHLFKALEMSVSNMRAGIKEPLLGPRKTAIFVCATAITKKPIRMYVTWR